MAQHLVPVSIGEYLDRMAVLWVKVSRFTGTKRHDSLKRFYRMEQNLNVPAEHDVAVNELYRQLVDLHLQLFDTEDEIREAASRMPVQQVGSTKGWFDASVADDSLRGSLIKHTQSAYTISLCNTSRHKLVAEIDALVGDITEPKSYKTVT